MGTAYLKEGTYSVCETPRLKSRRTGDIKNQYPLNSTSFASTACENGFLLVVNEYAETIDLPAAITDYVYLHCSPCKDYEGLGKAEVAVNLNEMLPVMYKLTKGDVIVTDAVKWNDATYADVAAVVAAIKVDEVYGIPSTTGHISLVGDPGGTENVVLKLKSITTTANGNKAGEFVVVKAIEA